jgi:hypothetical protein
MMEKLKKLSTWMNEKGIPVPLARKNGEPSASFTLVCVSTFFLVLSLFDSINPLFRINFDNASLFAWSTYGLYFGRNFSMNGNQVLGSDETKKDK